MKNREKLEGYVDLHTHTTASDGTLSPEELVKLAAKEEIVVLAVTDHDGVSGLHEAMQAGKKYKVNVIPGIECTTTFEKGARHILGYYIDPDSKAIQQFTSIRKHDRVGKIVNTVMKLKELGLDINFQDVQKFSVDGTIGRPHVAQALIEKGYASSRDEAFDRYLGKGKPAYVAGGKFTPEEVIAVIKKAGGIPVLAHPFQMNFPTIEETLDEVKRLVDLGVEGVEIIYPEHTSKQNFALIRFAIENNLYVTVGSDFHGENKPNKLGCCLEKEKKLTWNIYSGLGKMFIK